MLLWTQLLTERNTRKRELSERVERRAKQEQERQESEVHAFTEIYLDPEQP